MQCLKNSKNCVFHNFVKFSPTLIIFSTKMAKMIELCKVGLFSTSPNLCQCTTMSLKEGRSDECRCADHKVTTRMKSDANTTE